jgi:hypothetical protein
MGWFGPNTWGDDARAYDRSRKLAAKDAKRRQKLKRQRAKSGGKPRRQVFGPFYWQ